MSAWIRGLQDWLQLVWQWWDRFWFTPAAPETLAFIRILAGAMLFYTHLVWSLDLLAFLGPNSWVSHDTILGMYRGSYAWSYLWYVESPALLWLLHVLALVVFAALMVGFYTRAAAVLAAVITLSYCHRLAGALFGLDQVNGMLAIYLLVGPCGAAYSLDQWLANRKLQRPADPRPSISANVAVRLIQLHMCVIYLFGGIGKMRGELWWDGSACWFAIANYEYQSLDLTWLVRFPFLIALATHVTVFWETFYPFLVWSRVTRPIALATAVLVHGGIALFLGMPTFGLAMLIGNLAFVAPETVRGFVHLLARTKAEPTPAPAPHRSPAAAR
jgi:hypothetical protein